MGRASEVDCRIGASRLIRVLKHSLQLLRVERHLGAKVHVSMSARLGTPAGQHARPELSIWDTPGLAPVAQLRGVPCVRYMGG